MYGIYYFPHLQLNLTPLERYPILAGLICKAGEISLCSTHYAVSAGN